MATSSIIFLLSLFSLLILGQLQRIEFFPFPSFYIHDLLLLSWLFFLVKKDGKLIINKIQVLGKKYLKHILIIIGWVALGWLMAIVDGRFDLKAVAYLSRFSVYGFVFWWLMVKKALLSAQVKLINLVLGFFLLIGGLLQYLFMPDMRFLSILGWDDHYFRLVGSQFDPNFMGIILILFFLQLEKLPKIINKRWLVLILKFMGILGLALTFSRSSYLVFVLIVFLSAGFKVKKYWSVMLLAVLIFLIPKPAGEGVVLLRTASIEARLSTSKQSLVNLHGYEWLIGQGLFVSDKSNYTNELYLRPDHAGLPDNFALLLLQSGGVIGLSVVSFLILKYLWQLSKKNPRQALLVLAVLCHSMFNNSLFQPFVFLYLAIALVGEVES